MSKKVSVIVPVYNVERFLPDCMESLLKQNYDNLEIILIDDGSPDKCGDICDQYAKEHNNVFVIHQKNQGVSAARNHGLEKATGEYISFVDPDDVVAQNVYSIMIPAMEKENVEIGRFKNQSFFSIDDILNEKNENEGKKYKVYSGYDRVNQVIVKSRSACLGIFQSSLVRSLKFPEQYAIGEDVVFLCNALLKAKKVLMMDKIFYWRRINMSSATRSPYKSSWLHVLEANMDIENMLIKANKKYKNIAACIFYRQTSIMIFSMKNSYNSYLLDINEFILPQMKKRWGRFMITPFLTIKEKMGISLYCITVKGFYLLHKIYKKLKSET